MVAKLLPCGLSPFPRAVSGSPRRTVSVLWAVAVCQRDLCSRESCWGPCSPPGLATAWAFVARLTLRASTREDFLVVSPPGLPSRADAAFSPSQYYEMSYGLNIEMHKQVSLCGMGALSLLPVHALTSGPIQGHPRKAWEVAPCRSPGKAVLVGAVLPSVCFGSSAPLCVMALACLLSSPHTRVHSSVSCHLLAGLRVRVPGCVAMRLLRWEESSGGGLVLAWLLAPVVSGHLGTIVEETGSRGATGAAASRPGDGQGDELCLAALAAVQCQLALGGSSPGGWG